ncbi:unnamed protein product [Periconia digitata]|uniref:U6 snRNA phosphodiesterase n=1 Tax=Periconia digitata TaxID=1303443 RepID=A0A9W4U7G5_9PLEO|nr:unnamed protein product [Periconia digitata]
MSLVLYPDSDQEDEDTHHAPSNVQPASSPERKADALGARSVKRKRSADLPPLPAAFHNLYSVNARISTSDDPSLHGGRKRAVPHVQGNWPSHVFLEWVPSQPESQALRRLIDQVEASIKHDIDAKNKSLQAPDIVPSLLSPLGTPLPLHISLSRTLQIKTDNREPFLDTLIASIRTSMVKPFSLRVSKLKWVPNFERNRWFLVLVLQKPPQNELNRLLDSCNQATCQTGHPGLYVGGRGDGPMPHNTAHNQSNSLTGKSCDNTPTNGVDRTENFHVSVAWNLAEPDADLIQLVEDLDVSKYVATLQPAFDAVKVKIGNSVHDVNLGTRKSGLGTTGGLLGLG